MHNSLIKVIAATLLSIFLSWAYFFMPQIFFSLDNRLRDFMFVIRGELHKSSNVVIVDIDENSLKEYGQWPWPRNIITDLLYNISDAGAGIIGLDIVFAEADRSSPHRIISKFPKLAKELSQKLEDYDKILATCLSSTPVVGGYIFTFDKIDDKQGAMIPAVFVEKGMKETHFLQAKGVILNIDILQNALYSSGFFNNTPDESGMIRSVPLVMKYDGVLYPSLALEMIRIYSGANTVKIIGDEAGVESIEFKKFKIPTDRLGRLVVNFRGKGKYFKYISAKDILDNNFDKKDIEGKFVLIGTSALGLFDLRSIPFDSAIAGVEVHANAIDNILVGDYLTHPADAVIYDLISIWLIVFSLLLLFSLLRSLFIIPVAILVLYGLFQLYFTILFQYGMVLNLLFPLIAYILTLVVSVGIDYIIASRQKEQAKRMLGKKVSPAVMEYLLLHSDEKLIASKEVNVTVFFSDIRSFTSISEKINSPDRLIRMLNAYMTPMVENIVNHKGTIDKFIGDSIMAYWNAPLDIAGHADEALHSAIQQIEMLDQINKKIKPQYDVEIFIGIGIHTGMVTAGDMGSNGRSDYTVIGDSVNLASRLEGLTKQYDAQIIISKATYEMLEGEYLIRPLDLVEVKGKKHHVEIYEVICNNKNISDFEMNKYLDAIKLFRDAKVGKAYKIFEKLQKDFPSKLYAFYISRCEIFMQNPDLKFTPILKMTTK